MTDPDEDRIRGLLRAAVPEAPEVSPPARSARSRGPVVAVLAAAAAVAAIAVVPLALGGDDSADRATTPEPMVERTPLPTDPYAAAPCPGPGGLRGPAETRVPDLAEATAIRLCTGAAPRMGQVETDLSVPDDALVTGMDDLEAGLAQLTDADPDACAAFDYFDPSSIVVTTPDGGVVLSASACASLRLPGEDGGSREVSAGAVANLVVEALGRQRATALYPPSSWATSGSEMSAWCDASATVAPVVPAESDLAAAVLCPDYNIARATPTPLDGAALERLRDAWEQTDDPVRDPDFDGYDDEQANLVALTSYGDLVQMVPKEGVDGLVLVVPTKELYFGPTSVVPITLDDLAGD